MIELDNIPLEEIQEIDYSDILSIIINNQENMITLLTNILNFIVILVVITFSFSIYKYLNKHFFGG